MREFLDEGSLDDRSKWWRSEEAPVVVVAAAAAARLRASSISSLSSSFTWILLGFLLNIFSFLFSAPRNYTGKKRFIQFFGCLVLLGHMKMFCFYCVSPLKVQLRGPVSSPVFFPKVLLTKNPSQIRDTGRSDCYL